MPLFDAPDYSIDFNQVLEGALNFIPELIVGRHGVPDLTHPMSTYRYLEKRRNNLIESVKQRPLIRLWDKDMRPIGQVAQELRVMVEEVMADSGAGNIVIRRDNWLSDFLLFDKRVEEDVHITVDPIATQPDWRTRWGGKVIGINAKRDSDGLHTVEMEAVSNREHLKHLLAGANPIFPPEVQLPKMWVFPWNCRTALSTTMFINLARQYEPFLSIPTNIANPAAWIGTGILQGLNPLAWPIQTQFCNPLTDQSRFTVFTSRWTDMHTTTAQLLEDAGCMIRAYTWLTEDKTSPHPELHLGLKQLPIFGPILQEISDKTGLPTDLDELVRPRRNAIILAVEDKSGTTGPTGTLLDGPIKLAAATADDLITETLFPIDKDADGYTDPFFRKLALVAPKPPWVVFRDGEYSGIIESQRSLHASTAKTIMVGSHSPAWLNQLITFGIKYGLSQLSYVIQFAAAGGPDSAEVTGWQNLGTPGLEEVYQGQLDDCCCGTTQLDGPDGVFRLDKLAEYGGPFKVWSITPDGERVPATALFAFKKGRAALYKYTLSDGRSITVTERHRFLTDVGYVHARDVAPGSLIATTDGRFLPVIAVAFDRVDDYYDLHVPGWENYAANGVWNHNTFFAWERFTDPVRALRIGDFGFLEHFETGSGSAYTVAAVLDLRNGHWKTRSFISFKTSVRNGAPYLVGYDFELGDRLAFEMANVLHVDQCTAIRHSWDKDKPITVELSIGNDKLEEDPVGVATRALSALWNTVGMFLGEGGMF